MKKTVLAAVAVATTALMSNAAMAGVYQPLKGGDKAVFATTSGPFVNQQTDLTVEGMMSIGGSSSLLSFSDFLGMGPTLVDAPANSEVVSIRPMGVSTFVRLADFSRPVGTSFALNLGCTKSAKIGAKGLTLNTDAGTFTNVVRLDFTASCADAGLGQAWFAPNVGLVQFNQSNIAGSVTTSLVAATISGKHFPQRGLALSADVPTTSFVLSGGIKYVSAVLNVKNISGKNIDLKFNGNPGYDAVLVDAFGNELNRWSTPRIIATTYPIRTESLANGASLSQTLALPLADQDGRVIPAGNYKLRLELTATYLPSTATMWKPVPSAIEIPLFVDTRMTRFN